MEQNGEPINKPTHLWSIDLQQRRHNEEKTVSSASSIRKVRQLHVNQ